MKSLRAVSLTMLVACRFGGPTSNPERYVAFPDAEADHAQVSVTTGADGASPPAADDAAAAAPDDVSSPGGEDGGGLDATPAAEGSCASTVAVCDPVHNTGCNPLQQCDVNPLQATMATGQCVFGGGADAGLCTASLFTESCPPGSTCLDGGCRQLCFCDTDCPVGQCCSDRSGPSGFTLCRPCP